MSEKFSVGLDFETADRILVCALKEHYDYVKKEYTDYVADGNATAAEQNLVLMFHMKQVLAYFGEKV